MDKTIILTSIDFFTRNSSNWHEAHIPGIVQHIRQTNKK